MASETKSGGTFANDSTVGLIPWTNPGNAVASDDSDADVILTVSFDISYYLKATNFGFAIPDGAVIDGIKAEMERAQETAATGDIEDNSVKIVRGGTIEGDEKANTGVNWPTSDTIFTYGGPTDKWGLTWTAAQINASDFGFVISALNDNTPAGSRQAEIDHLTLIVYYTLLSKMMFT